MDRRGVSERTCLRDVLTGRRGNEIAIKFPFRVGALRYRVVLRAFFRPPAHFSRHEILPRAYY